MGRAKSTEIRSCCNLYDRAADVVRAIYDRRIATPATLDAEHYFPNAKRFTERWTDIRREALGVAATLPKVPRFHDIMPAQADISANDGRDWRMFIMKAYGVTLPENLARARPSPRCSTTRRRCCRRRFRSWRPASTSREHRGPFRAILRFHLMLSMPNDERGQPACVMNIDGVPYPPRRRRKPAVGRHLPA